MYRPNTTKITFFFGLSLLFNNLFAQQKQDCNCSQSLENLITKIENEYPGFEEKTIHDVERYTIKKEDLLKEAINSSACFEVLNEYIGFFKDKHIYLSEIKDTATENTFQQEGPEVEAKKISSTIFYIKLSSFRYENVEKLKMLVSQNRKQIEKTKALIIDVRDNYGGTDDVYQPLLPYILTNPLRIMNVAFLSTHTLINGLRDYAVKNIKTDTLNEIKNMEEGLKIYKDSLGKFVLYDGKKVTIDTIIPKKKSPSQIIILSNHNVASAAENFVYSAKQSKKVKIIGTPTMGALDYGSQRIFDFGCPQYELYLPTYRSARLPQYPIDNIGVQPDIYMDETVEDWLDFAIKYINE
jgi:hypothetical protein